MEQRKEIVPRQLPPSIRQEQREEGIERLRGTGKEPAFGSYESGLEIGALDELQRCQSTTAVALAQGTELPLGRASRVLIGAQGGGLRGT
ncbi:MAG: hypothetical protein OXI33_12975, partial [Chloroflexota bacterium]|nr:hypothetical protein [Chloroflexota bacterium]